MDPEGSGEPPDTDFVIQNRTGTVQHATVQCQTSRATVFSKMVELASGETLTFDDLPAELIQFQVSVADGPKGSNMYDMTSVSGTVVAGISGADVVFETTTEPIGSASELADIFEDGGAESAEASSQATDTPEGSGDNTPGESAPEDNTPGESAPEDNTPGESAPEDNTPGESAPKNNTPRDTDRNPSGADTSGGSTPDTGEPTRGEGGGPARGGSGTASSDQSGQQTHDTGVVPSAGSDASPRTDPQESETETHGEAAPDTPDGVAHRAADTGSSTGGTRETSDRTPDGASASGPDTDASGEGGAGHTAGAPSKSSAGDNPERTPGSGEIHCRSCGSIIRGNAEICPECGVQNAAQAAQQAGQTDDAGRASPGSGTGSSAHSAGDDPGREPGPDESHCRNCGEIVRNRAEICPECGVRNAAHAGHPTQSQPTQSARGGTGARPAQQRARGGTGAQPAQAERMADTPNGVDQRPGSEPSGSWVNGVRLGALLWLLVLLVLVPTILRYQGATGGSGVGLSPMLQSLGLAALIPPLQLLAWVVLPVSLYFDLKYVDYHVDEWPLSGRLYLVSATILPVLTQVLGAAALFVNSGGILLAGVIPVVLLALSVRHLRTRSRLV
ncbi:hypothetical protein GCM10008995_06420 [Halobellus salinus]|uniref:Zinc ribbon domain-containing protein n=1 Tax=Halobellus salinus TaxID=931585 RepID=A0A830ECR7_9EURY|nr:hypothetical protein [Halobellus salinus]GGI99212.1 hypothetical protein GCM10008995_06420 [Halobellus salinus]SMP04932.1 hypothetical protein SAMN06265347_10233 [Halobellus salinus]